MRLTTLLDWNPHPYSLGSSIPLQFDDYKSSYHLAAEILRVQASGSLQAGRRGSWPKRAETWNWDSEFDKILIFPHFSDNQSCRKPQRSVHEDETSQTGGLHPPGPILGSVRPAGHRAVVAARREVDTISQKWQ